MRRLSVVLIATVSAVAFTQVALAADLPVKAPRYAPPPAPVYSWAGFYMGGNVGYSWGKADSDISADPVIANFGAFTIPIPGFVGSDSVKPKGIIGGGQIGYNWQFSPNWVAGIEADWQASGEKASHSFTNPFSFAVPGVSPSVTGAAVTDYEAKISWFGTLRGRIGYAWDGVMLYATGGLAYGEVKIAGTNTVSGTVGGLPPIPFLAVTAMGHSEVNAGWTVGAGIEGVLADHWTWRAEYLYMDLGSIDDPDTEVRFINASGGRVTTHTNFTDNILRVGLNYKFH